MRKILVLLMAAGLLCTAAAPAHAIDFKVKGQFLVGFDYGQHGDFKEDTHGYGKQNQDAFNVRQRTRLRLDAIANENLSGTVHFEINNQWGKGGDANWGGAALGADGKNVLVKNAYIDWTVPDTDLHLRMGLQPIALPSVIGSQVQDDDAAGIVATYAFNPNVALTGLWVRLYNDNYDGSGKAAAGYQDNVDLFALSLPLTFDGVKVTPWIAYGMAGKNAGGNSTYMNRSYLTNINRHGSKNNDYASMYMGGVCGTVSLWDPFQISAEFFYTGMDTGYDRDNISGWFATLLAEYKADWGTPGVFAWYASGEDGDSSNGSERFYTFAESGIQNYSQYGLNGSKSNIARDGTMGYSLAGTWGVGLRLRDVSFVENLKHSVRVLYYGGTNDEDAVRAAYDPKKKQAYDNGFSLYTQPGSNLATSESAIEFGLGTEYRIYENLKVVSDIAYIKMNYDEDIKRGYDKADAWNVNLTFIYNF